MELVRKIEDVNIGFEVFKDQIYFQQGDQLFKGNIESEKTNPICEIEHSFSGISKTQNGLVLVSAKGFQILSNENILSEFIEIEGGIGDYKIKESKSLIITEKLNGTWKQSLIDPIANSVRWSSNEKERIIYSEGGYYVINNQNIYKKDSDSGFVIWAYKYNEGSFQPVNIQSNEQYCLIGIPNKDLLLCLNNLTGIEIWSKPSIPKAIIIDNQKNIAHQLMVNYNCIDLMSGEVVKSRVDREYFSEIRIQNQKNNILQYQNYLVVNDSRSKRTGALNLETLNFDKYIDGISIPEGYKIQTNEDYIFLQGIDKTLNIVKMKAR